MVRYYKDEDAVTQEPSGERPPKGIDFPSESRFLRNARNYYYLALLASVPAVLYVTVPLQRFSFHVIGIGIICVSLLFAHILASSWLTRFTTNRVFISYR